MNINKKIAIYRTRGIGDVVLSFDSLELLSKYDTQIYYIGYGTALEFVKYFFPDIITVDIGKNKLGLSFRIITKNLKGLNAFVDLQSNSRSVALRILLCLKYKAPIFSWKKKSLSKLLVVLLNRIIGRKRQLKFIKDFRQTTVKELVNECFNKCITSIFDDIEYKLTQSNNRGHKTASEQRTLVIAPGGSHIVKQAPAELIISITNKILNKIPDLKLILLGDVNDILLCNTIEEAFSDNVSIQNKAGKCEVSCLVDMILNSNSLLTTDSAISHLGTYLNIPTSVLLGPTIEGFGYAIERNNTKVFSADINCRPCSRHGNINCIYNDKLCFDKIDSNIVAEHILEILN